MPTPPFVSYARNGEDVVLWRALAQVADGKYLAVTASPSDPGTTPLRALDERGWTGVTVASGDVEQGATEVRLDALADEHGLRDVPVHALLVDSEDVLGTGDLRTWRPWVVVVRTGAPTAAEQPLLAAGYERTLFDGVSCFYVADEHAEALRDALGHAACVGDEYTTAAQELLEERLATATADAVHWRSLALTSWADAVAAALVSPAESSADAELAAARAELDAIRQTLSWRVTRPLRGARRVGGLIGRR